MGERELAAGTFNFINYNFSDAAIENHRANGSAIIREQDRLVPIANVGRIMKQILPPKAKISKEAKETMQECVSEFVSFVTGEASDRCHREMRKTLNGDDICWALGSLGFDDYTEPLKRYLNKFRDQFEVERANQNKVNYNSNSGGDDDENNVIEVYNNNFEGNYNCGDGDDENNIHGAYYNSFEGTNAASSSNPIGMWFPAEADLATKQCLFWEY